MKVRQIKKSTIFAELTIIPLLLLVYNEVQRKIFAQYLFFYTYSAVHVGVIFMWLNSEEKYRGWPAYFFSIFFGIPHAVIPMTLLCQINHVVLLFTSRVEALQAQVRNYTPDELHDKYVSLRDDAFSLCKRLNVDGLFIVFPLTLILAIVVHGIAVFYFDKDRLSFVYMILNIVLLLNLIKICTTIPTCINDLKDSISHLPTNTCLGNLASPDRLNMVLSLNIVAEGVPTVNSLGYSLTSENFGRAFVVSLAAMASFVWNQIENIIKNDDISSKILDGNELQHVRSILKILTNETLTAVHTEYGGDVVDRVKDILLSRN